ncbi:MAG: peroxiredoxin family protein [Verrucomicrobiaceae bacterium]
MRNFLSLISLCLVLPLLAQDELKEGHSHQGHAFNEGPRQAGPLLGNTGEVHLPVTTTWDQGQAYFDQGIGQLHGFWYYEAERSFRNLLAHDPACPMAYWGLAMANWENEKRAKEFITKGSELLEKATLTPLEKAYFNAYAKYFGDKPKEALERRKALLADLENIILDHPHDLEAKAFYVCHTWQFSRKGIKINSHIALDAILDQIFLKSPHHPAHHYCIHLWDYRRPAEALGSAARLGQTAPGIAHMWHMPGHTYSKSKRYHDAAWQQQASARVDHAHMMANFLLPDQIHNYAHNNGWLSENFAYLGNAQAAVDMAKSLLANPRHPKLNTESKGSQKEGLQRLTRALEDFELWQQALDLQASGWLEKFPANESLDAQRLRLVGLAHFHLGQQQELADTITQLEAHLTRKEKEKKEAEDKARTEAEAKIKKDEAPKEKPKDAKNDPVAKAVKDAGNRFNGSIKNLNKQLKLLRGCHAQLSGDKKAALESIAKSNALPDLGRKLALGAPSEDLLPEVEKHLTSGTKQAVPLANAIHLAHQLGKNNQARKAFDELRTFSSQIDLTAPPFARLAPLAKDFAYPADWRLPHTPATDLLPRPSLDSLGPLHWTPPAAPDFNLPDQHGKNLALTSQKGKPFILVFYLGAGCLHCTEQLTAMADRYPDFQKAKLPILAISTDPVDQLKESQDNYTKGTIPFPIVSNSAKDIFKAYTAHDDFEDQPLHGTFIIDPSGRILWQDISADPFMDLDFLIKEGQRMLKIHR